MDRSINQAADTVQPTNRRPPGPPSGIFGLASVIALQRDPLSFVESLASYGDLSYCQTGPLSLWLVNHPDLLHEVLVEQWESFDKSQLQKKVLGQVVGNSTFNSDGSYWKQQRKLVQPSFHSKRIAAYADIMVEETTRLIDSWPTDKPFDLMQSMFGLTMAIITRTVFGGDIRGREAAISQALTVCLETETQQMQSPMRFPAWLPIPSHLRFQRAITFFDDLMYEFINKRRQAGHIQDNHDLLSMLLLATDENGQHMTDEEVRNEGLTIFSAGYETTANALSWLWIELARHPEVEAKLVEEANRVLGDRTPVLADVRQMTYTEQVIKETLRLHPPAWGLMRQTNQAVTLGGWHIPKGDIVFLCPHVTHRDPRFWDQPTVFNPDRFAEGWDKQVPRYAYIPFGGGPHVCTGQAMATMELQLVLPMIMRRCHFDVVPGQDFTPRIIVVQRPGFQIWANMQRR